MVVILAGGMARRMGNEKAIIELGDGIRLIDLIVARVIESKAEDFEVAVTNNTPETSLYCQKQNYRTIETPGWGYHEDLRYLLDRYPVFIAVACDIPFLLPEHIDALIDFYSGESVTGAVPLSMVPEGVTPGFSFTYNGERLVACGINVVTNSSYSVPFVFHDPMLAININTPADLQVAMRYLEIRRGRDLNP